jgi:hypothetical protein
MHKDHRFIAGIAFGFVVCLLSFGVGIWVAVGHTAEDLDKFAFSLLSVLGSWVSGIGALGAVVVALYVANKQIRDAKIQDAVKCIHHSMAIVNDLSARLKYLQTTLVTGDRPLAALTRNAESISRRYEALYDRDIYRHLPGSVIDQITNMSASFFGIDALVACIASALKNEPHFQLKSGSQVDDVQLAAFATLQSDLDDLFTALKVCRESFSATPTTQS